MPAEQYHDFPLAPRDRTWDKNAAVPRLRRWASRDGSGDKEQMDWQKYRKVFFWHEAGELNDFGQFKFPYCDIINDGPHVVHNAVQNALARIDGSNIPEEDKPAVRRVAQRQMNRFNDEEESEGMATGFYVYYRKFGEPTPSQLEKINTLAKRPLTKEEVFVFPDKLVGDKIIPNKYIQIHKSLLNVFKEDAKAGVSFLIDHPWAGVFARPKPAIAYGRTFDSQLKRSDIEGENWALYADHYIVRGKEFDGISTDYIIASIEDGTFFDTSIGWSADVFECSICGNDYRDYSKCQHIAGREYDGNLCYIMAKPPGFLMENSIVFDGAYPGAGVLSSVDDTVKKGEMVIVDDLKGLSQGIMLFHTYSARKGKLLTFARREDMEKKIMIQGVTFSKGGENKLDEIKTQEQQATVVDHKAEETYITKEQVQAKLGREISADELLKLAKEGDDYLKALQKEAEEWGVRAYGDDYNAEAWEVRFAIASSKELKNLIETFKAEAAITIPAGRKSDPAANQGLQAGGGIPDEAFKA